MLNSSFSFLIRCSQTGEVWLFNCPDGCQQFVSKLQVRLNQINHIVINSLKTNEIGGLVGLLSSLSLNDRIQNINLYGPPGLLTYINLARKYSKTTFKYQLNVYIHQYTTIHKYGNFHLYIYPQNLYKNDLQYIFVEKERQGRFQSCKAELYGLSPGPIYGKLKMHNKYILPDGTIIAGKYFTNMYIKGIQVLYYQEKYSFRINHELSDRPYYTFRYKCNTSSIENNILGSNYLY
uniref:Ribonuclease Z n=1 Tax=Titanophycus setchellii TaxID=940129 RepID=A0A1G4NXX5_9FLOR|nr:Ribonuclease Z [Titanophycus setchellii]SCW23507.1 Ribonuclease Z [Titanophycus setchellii]